MKRRNPMPPQRRTRANELKTEQRIEQFYGLQALLEDWESQPDEVQIAEHDYITALKARVRMSRQLILHRADPAAKV